MFRLSPKQIQSLFVCLCLFSIVLLVVNSLIGCGTNVICLLDHPMRTYTDHVISLRNLQGVGDSLDPKPASGEAILLDQDGNVINYKPISVHDYPELGTEADIFERTPERIGTNLSGVEKDGHSARKAYNCVDREHRTEFTLTKEAIVNHLAFSFPLNAEHVCENDTVHVFIPIFSDLSSTRRRSAQRAFHGKRFANNRNKNIAYLFFVGLPRKNMKEGILERLAKESEKHRDIVQINVVDSYRNNVYKIMAAIYWVTKFCPKAEFILKTDDDVLIDNVPYLAMSLYNSSYQRVHFIMGSKKVNAVPERIERFRYAISVEEYPDSIYPPFVLGQAMAFPTSTARLLYQKGLRSRIIHLHDVFITGICSQNLEIPIIHNERYTFPKRFKMRKMLFYG